MIWSGLPYGKDDIEKAYLEGAHVDLSNLNFPTCGTLDENSKAALVYLRNTDYKVELHFEGMTFEQKASFLKTYMDSTIVYDIPELNSTMIQVLFACAGITRKDITSVMNELELISFVSKEFEFCFKYWQLIASLPYFAIYRISNDDGIAEELETGKVPSTDEVVPTKTLIRVMKLPEFDGLYEYATQIEPKFYNKLFTVENTELFEGMLHLSFMTVLTGMVSSTEDEWKSFISGIAEEPVEA